MAGKNRINFEVGFSVDKTGLQSLQSELQQIYIKSNNLGSNAAAGYQKAATTAQQLDKILEKTFNSDLGTLNVTKFNQELNKSGMTLKSIKTDLLNAGNQGAAAYNKMAQAILGTNVQLAQSNKLLDSMATTMFNTVKWGITSSIFNTITNSISKSYSYVKQLDSSLNDIRIVTGKAADEMDVFAIKANNAAKALGASTLDYSNAALIYYQQGLSDQEAQARAETTVKVANITGQTGQAVSEELTAVWNGYKVSAEETELYIDKLAAVAATTAADLEELSTGMSKVASAANAMGVDFDDLNAQIATIVSVTRQAPESVGTALKTIYARLGDLKVDGVDEFGVKLGEVSSQLQTMGIEILDANGDMRAMSDVMAEVAEKWDTWTRAQQQAAAVAMAGKRQYNNLVALFENWDMYSDALETSVNSLGTLQKQQDIYMESTEAKLKTLKATWQSLYQGLLKNDDINKVIEGFTSIVDVVDKISRSFGGGIKTITAFGAIFASIFNKQISSLIIDGINKIEVYNKNLEMLRLKTKLIQEDIAKNPGLSPTKDQAAAQANTQAQIEIAKQIQGVQGGLTQEQGNLAISYQQEIGNLTGQIQKLKTEVDKVKISSKDSLNTFTEVTKTLKLDIQDSEKGLQKFSDYLTLDADSADKVSEHFNNIYTSIQKADTTLQSFKNSTEASKTQIQRASLIFKALRENGIELENGQRKLIIETTSWNKQLQIARSFLSEEKITYDDIIKALEIANGLRGQAVTSTEQLKNKTLELKALLEQAKKNMDITGLVQTTTSLASGAAMAMSTINSLNKVFEDDTVPVAEKMQQIFMTLGLSIPATIQLINGFQGAFQKGSQIIKGYNALLEANVISQTKLSAAEITGTKIKQINTLATKLSEAIQKKENLTEEEQAIVTVLTSNNIIKKTAALKTLNAEKLKSIGVDETLIGTTEALNTSLTTSVATLGAYAAAIGAVALVVMGGIYLSYKIINNQLEETKARNDAIRSIREEANAKKEEIDANNELYKSYLKTYDKYKQGISTKEEMSKVTQELTDKISEEAIAVANLTGNYDYLASKVKEYTLTDLQEKINIDQNALNTLKETFLEDLKKEEIDRSFSAQALDEFGLEKLKDFNSSGSQYFTIEYRPEAGSDLSRYGISLKSDLNAENFDFLAYKEEVENLKNFFNDYSNNVDTEIAKYFLNTPATGEAYALENEIRDNEIKLKIAADSSYDFVQSYEDFESNVSRVIDELSTNPFHSKNQDTLTKDALDILSEYSSINEDFKNKYLAIKGIVADYEKNNKNLFKGSIGELERNKELLKEELKKLSNADFNKVITRLDIDGVTSQENIVRAIHNAQQELDNSDLAIVTSLLGKVTSDKKLTKTELKEALGEQETLTSEYNTIMSDWENESQLDQVEKLRFILNEKIQINQDYLIEVKKLAIEELKVEKEKLINFEKEYENELKELDRYNELKNKQNDLQRSGSGSLSYDEQQELKELEAKKAKLTLIYEQYQLIKAEVSDLATLAKEGLPYEEFNDTVFTNLISGIDGLISHMTTLADLVALVGENWTIATKDIQTFAQNFPEVLAAQENFNYLQDGSIQLTEKGKQVLQENLQIYKDKLIAENEGYQQQLQKQAEIDYATAQYYKNQADLIYHYLENKDEAIDYEMALEKNEAEYEEKLMSILGTDNAKLNEIMQQNGINTAKSAKGSLGRIYGYYNQLGAIAAQASKAYALGKWDTWPGLSDSGESGFVDTITGDANFTEAQLLSPFKDENGNINDEKLKDLADSYMKLYEQYMNQGDIELSKKAGAGANLQSMLNAIDNSLTGKGNGKSSSKSKNKDLKSFDEEFDRYWEFKKAIDLLDKALSRLAKTQAKLHGKELIKSLETENQLLEKQKANYEAILKAQEVEAGELQGKLIYYGGAFADNGELANYAEVTTNMLNQYSEAVRQYNANAINEVQFTIYEKQYEDFKKALERYDTLYYSEMQDSLDKLDEAGRKQLENNLKAWETEIQIKLDLTEAERAWNDFVEKLEQDFRKIYEDFTIVSDFNVSDFDSYVNDFNTTLGAIKDVENEIDKLSSTGKSDMFEAMSEAQEKLKELGDQLLDNGNQLRDIYENVWDTYIDGLDQTADKLDDINNEFETITEELEHERKLVELLYGDKAYKDMDKYYKAQQKNINLQIDSYKKQRDFWQYQFEAAYQFNKDDHNVVLDRMDTWTEDMRAAYDKMIESQENLNDKIEEGIENLQDNYLNELAEVFDNLEKAVWGLNLDKLNDDWDRITNLADEYLDDIEGAYEIQTLANKIDKDIADVTDLKNQQKLQAFREKEIEILREKENLTQTDVDLVEARYDIMLKEMALEDARNAKTSMKLTRNTSGNWTYQYVADEEDVADKQQDLLQSYHNLYKMADDAYQHAMDLAMSTYEEMQDKMREIAEDTTLTEEEKMAKIQEIYDIYLPNIEAAVENSELYRREAIYATGATFTEVCEQDEAAYENLTNKQKELVDMIKDRHLENYEEIRTALIEDYNNIGMKAEETFLETNLNSQTTAADIIHQWADDDGESVKSKLNEAIDSIEENTKEYEEELNIMAEVADIDFENVRDAIEETEKRLEKMTYKTDELTNQSSRYIDRLREALGKLVPAWSAVETAIKTARQEMSEYSTAISNAAEAMRQFQIYAGTYNGLNLSALGDGQQKIPPYTIKDDSIDRGGRWQTDPNGVAGLVYKRDENGITYGYDEDQDGYPERIFSTRDIENATKRNGYNGANISAYISSNSIAGSGTGDQLQALLDLIHKLEGFATGGYTGDWSDDHGKLAILHGKELVLNQEDTANFLSGIQLIRDMSAINGSIENSIAQSIANMLTAFTGNGGNLGTLQHNSKDSVGNVFNITAEFPNAGDVESIKQAILSLPNLASQYVGQTY